MATKCFFFYLLMKRHSNNPSLFCSGWMSAPSHRRADTTEARSRALLSTWASVVRNNGSRWPIW